MSLIPSSERLVATLAVAVLVVCAAGPAAAITLSASGVPSDAEVGEDVTTTVTIEDPFTDAPDEWTLEGETELENVSWTVTQYDQGRQVDQQTYGGQEFSQDLTIDDGADEVEVEVTGTVPEVANYSYQPAEETTVATMTQRQGDSTEELERYSLRPFTQESQEARDAIDSAGQAIEAAGGDAEAEDLRESAISSYNNGNFENAIELAGNAESAAQQTQQRSTLLLYGGGAAVALVVVVGGVLFWRSRSGDDYDKLR